MSNPITWRNINGPSNHAATELLRQSGNSFNKAFDGIGSTIKDLQTRERNENTQNFLDTVAKYRTVDDLNEADTSGLFQKLISDSGGNIDRSQVRGAVDSRRSNLMNQALDLQKFDQTMQKYSEAPLVDDIRAAYARGNVPLGDSLRKGENLTVDAQLDTDRTTALSRAYQKAISDENHKFTIAQRNRTLASQAREDLKRERDKAQDKDINDIRDTRNNYTLSQLDKLQGAMEEVGISVGTDPSTFSMNQIENLKTSLRDTGLSGPSDTKELNELVRQYKINNPDYSPERVKRYEAAVRADQAKARQIEAHDQAQHQNSLNDLEYAYNPEGNNPYFNKVSFNPIKATNDIINKFQDKLEGLGSYDKEVTINKISELMTKGAVIGEDGQRLPLRPEHVEYLMHHIDDSWWLSPDTDLTEIDEEIKLNELNVPEQYKAYQDYLIKKLQLNAALPSNKVGLNANSWYGSYWKKLQSGLSKNTD